MKKVYMLTLLLSMLTICSITVQAQATQDLEKPPIRTEGEYSYTTNYGNRSVTIVSYDKSKKGKVVIPGTINGKQVDEIGEGAFENCKEITEVIIPNGVIRISYNAFRGNDKLKRVKLPDSLRIIDKEAFKDCISLSDIQLPPKLYLISKWAFYNCSSLTEIVIPTPITVISEESFKGCSSLKRIVIPENVKTISEYTFQGCTSLEEVIFPEKLNYIGSFAFMGCVSLKEITLPQITTLGDSAFRGCILLTKVRIPGTVHAIGYHAFARCFKLEEVVIEEGVTAIYGSAFEDCRNLARIDVPSTVDRIGDRAFYRCTTLRSFDMPDSVIYVGREAFEKCGRLRDVTLSKNLKELEKSAFSKCYSLREVTLPGTLETIDSRVFEFCTSLRRVDIQEGVKDIESWAFHCDDRIQYINIPDSLIYGETMILYKAQKLLFISEEHERFKRVYYSEKPYAIRTEDTNINNIYVDYAKIEEDERNSILNKANTWIRPELAVALEAGIVSDSMLRYDPKEPITRAEFLDHLVNFYNDFGGSDFVPLGKDKFMVRSNTGDRNNTVSQMMTNREEFEGQGFVTREELCTYIVNILKKAKVDFEIPSSFKKKFTDVTNVAPEALESMMIMNAYGVYNGSGDMLKPKNFVTREVAIVFMYRAFEAFRKL